jgi:tRNA A-37 threonylcarbamoyl transferase component Bud32
MTLKYSEVFFNRMFSLIKKWEKATFIGIRILDFMCIVSSFRVKKCGIKHDVVLSASEIASLPVCSINHKDKVVAQFNQNNVPLSHINTSENQQTEFKVRERNVVSLVVHKNQICLMKCYENISCLINEVRALDKLKNVTGTPQLIDFNLLKKQAYQSYMSGTGLAHYLENRGCSEGKVYLYENNMRTDLDFPNNFKDDYCMDLVSEEFIAKFRSLIISIHNQGILIRDVKFGNIINHQGIPYLVDFDCASILSNTDTNSLLILKENALFNRLLPLNLPTDANL